MEEQKQLSSVTNRPPFQKVEVNGTETHRMTTMLQVVHECEGIRPTALNIGNTVNVAKEEAFERSFLIPESEWNLSISTGLLQDPGVVVLHNEYNQIVGTRQSPQEKTALESGKFVWLLHNGIRIFKLCSGEGRQHELLDGVDYSLLSEGEPQSVRIWVLPRITD